MAAPGPSRRVRAPLSRLARAAGAVALLAMLAACAVQPVKPVLPELTPAQHQAAEAAQRTREAQLRGHGAWAMSGRIAVSKGRNGGSGRIEWQQPSENRYEVTVSAPVSRQSWRLTGDRSDGARLEGLEGGPREGPVAEALLFDATGWEIPLAQLPDWLRALRAAATTPADIAYGPDGRVHRIEQHGWTIEYQDWHPPAGTRPTLPRRIVARSGDATVRLVVDEWRL